MGRVERGLILDTREEMLREAGRVLRRNHCDSYRTLRVTSRVSVADGERDSVDIGGLFAGQGHGMACVSDLVGEASFGDSDKCNPMRDRKLQAPLWNGAVETRTALLAPTDWSF